MAAHEIEAEIRALARELTMQEEALFEALALLLTSPKFVETPCPWPVCDQCERNVRGLSAMKHEAVEAYLVATARGSAHVRVSVSYRPLSRAA